MPTTYNINVTNWNDPVFWSNIIETAPGAGLDFSALPSNFSVGIIQGDGTLTISDGTTEYVIGDATAASSDTTFGSGTSLENFTILIFPDGNNATDGTENNDTVDGGADNDALYGSGGNDAIDGGAGDDLLEGEAGDDKLDGGDGDDFVRGGTGADTLRGGDGIDVILGGDGTDTIYGGAGGDNIFGNDGADSIFGGDGSDDIYIEDGFGADTIDGGDGTQDDLKFGSLSTGITVTATGDKAGTATDGTDTLQFSNIEDIDGSGNDDVIDLSLDTNGMEADGFGGDDSITGGSGNDDIDGDNGDDTISGGAGDDVLSGGGDDDDIDGGAGNDTISGGDDNDTFNYEVGDGVDVITDFNTGNTGTLDDGISTNNDYINLSGFYDHVSEIHADHADDGVLNQSNTTDTRGRTTDYSDNSQFSGGSIEMQGASADSSSFSRENTGVVCFTMGTAIATPRGDILIDDLRIGDLVNTADNGPQPIRWIGTRTLDHETLKTAENLRPVLIKAGVLGNERPLLVSPQHCLMVGPNRLVGAKHLAETMRGVRIAHGKRRVTYIHLMFDAHQIIFAEGALSESFYPGPMSLEIMGNAPRNELFSLFPELQIQANCRDHIISKFGKTARGVAKKRDLTEMLAGHIPRGNISNVIALQN